MKVDKLSVNKYSEKILDDLVNKSEQYSIVVEQNKTGGMDSDCGINVSGSIEQDLKYQNCVWGVLEVFFESL